MIVTMNGEEVEVVIDYIEGRMTDAPALRRFKARSASRSGKVTHDLVVIGSKVSSYSCEAWSSSHDCHHARELERFVRDYREIPLGDPCTGVRPGE